MALEQAFTFPCQGETLLGIVHPAPGEVGLLVLVGGPQYRIGAHRQYLHLARQAAAAGIPAMRFDYRGVGDSSGTYPGFEHLEDDIAAAIDAFQIKQPQIRSVVLWGMCEGASAILLGGVQNARVCGAALVNPWVRSTSGEAQAYLKHYYGKRLFSLETWKRLLTGEINLFKSAASVLGLAKQARASSTAPDTEATAPFPARMAEGLRTFQGSSLLLMSEHDLVAREFDQALKTGDDWRGLQNKSERVDIPDTDHTFSSEPWRLAAAAATIAFVKKLAAKG